MDELTALLALARLPGIVRATKKRIAEECHSVAALFQGKSAPPEGMGGDLLRSFDGFGAIEDEQERLSKMGVQIITLRDEAYPAILRTIADAPVVLYKKGPLSLLAEAFAIVGARKATFEGMMLSERIAETLSSAGIAVVSGLARGIDASAHKGALHQKGGTIAVLGCGIERCYPAENWSLFQAIAQEGALVTEYILGDTPWKGHFPERNRIIAGLCKGVLVVEASERSGSLITARLGLEYGREVMAVPGRVFDETHRGANNLIKQGARLVQDIGDIVSCCFPRVQFRTETPIDMDGDEDYIYRLMGVDRVRVDELIEKSRFETKKVMTILTKLEMKEMVRPIPGGFYMRKVKV